MNSREPQRKYKGCWCRLSPFILSFFCHSSMEWLSISNDDYSAPFPNLWQSAPRHSSFRQYTSVKCGILVGISLASTLHVPRWWFFALCWLLSFSSQDKLNARHIVKCMELCFANSGRGQQTVIDRFTLLALGCFQGDLRFSRGTRQLRSLQRQNCLSKTLHRQPVAKRRRNISGAFDFVFRSPV